MAVTFEANGTVSCNSILRNWAVEKNQILEANPGDLNNIKWSYSNCSNADGGGDNAYHCWRSVKFNANTTAMLTLSTMRTPVANHKYYGAEWVWSYAGSSAADARFEWYLNDTATGHLVFAQNTGNTNGQWKLMSSVQQLSSVTSGTWIIRDFMVNGTREQWRCRRIIFDITNAFGSTIANKYTNDQWKQWIDAVLREHRTSQNEDLDSPVDPSVTFSQTTGSIINHDNGITSGAYPRNRWMRFRPQSAYQEGFANIANMTLSQYAYYYAYCYQAVKDDGGTDVYYNGCSNDLYWPVAEPNMGQRVIRPGTELNKYGNFKDWRRVSFQAARNNWGSGSYAIRYDVNNMGRGYDVASAQIDTTDVWIHGMNHNYTCQRYNQLYGTNISFNDVLNNRAFYDCWCDGRDFIFLHCPSPEPADKQIKFNTQYDIICNDVIIEPHSNHIYFDQYGRLHCKNLNVLGAAKDF